MNKILFLVVMLFIVSAISVEETILKYYEITKNENIDEYKNIMDFSNLNEQEITNSLNAALKVWEAYDTEFYKINDIKYGKYGDYAIATYRLNAQLSGVEEVSYDLEYIMLLHKIDNDWKVVFVMPLDDYLELTEEMKNVEMINDYLDEKKKDYEEVKKGSILFDGEEMTDLSDEIKNEVNKCLTDQYCEENGLGKCENGVCVEDNICLGTISLIGLVIFGIAKRNI